MNDEAERSLTPDELIEWNIHRNIAGWALIAFVISRTFSRLPGWNVPPLVAKTAEVIFVGFVVITAVVGVLARNKQTRAEVRFMTKSPWVLKISVSLATAYAIGVIVI